MTDWNSELYLKFDRERTQAALDLLAKIASPEPKSIIDLGCGPGNSTQLLRQRFPEADIVGIDVSRAMLETAIKRVPSAQFLNQDISSWHPGHKVDLIFANAALHLVTDHHLLLAHFIDYLTPGGRLAVQMPDNMQDTSHALIRMISADGPWAHRLVPIAKTRARIAPADDYYQILCAHCQHIQLWTTTYVHPLDSVDSIVDWFRGSGLRPFLELLSPEEQQEFLQRYRAELLKAYTVQPDGKVLLTYPRLFFVAQK